MRRASSPVAAEIGHLVLRTGWLAYPTRMDPRLRPRQLIRHPTSLAPTPHDLRMVLAAVHHATDTLTHIAAHRPALCPPGRRRSAGSTSPPACSPQTTTSPTRTPPPRAPASPPCSTATASPSRPAPPPLRRSMTSLSLPEPHPMSWPQPMPGPHPAHRSQRCAQQRPHSNRRAKVHQQVKSRPEPFSPAIWRKRCASFNSPNQPCWYARAPLTKQAATCSPKQSPRRIARPQPQTAAPTRQPSSPRRLQDQVRDRVVRRASRHDGVRQETAGRPLDSGLRPEHSTAADELAAGLRDDPMSSRAWSAGGVHRGGDRHWGSGHHQVFRMTVHNETSRTSQAYLTRPRPGGNPGPRVRGDRRVLLFSRATCAEEGLRARRLQQ